jgi:hypothetical protein
MRCNWVRNLGLLVAVGAACSDSSGPDLNGPAFFTATLDGVSWAGDTTVAVLTNGSHLSVTGVRSASPTEEQEITLTLEGFGKGTFVLGDQTAAGVAALTVMQVDNHVVTGISHYLSSPQHPGELRITGISTSDSVVTGSFAFEAASQPDTASHHQVSGQFRVRYATQVVYPPTCPECQLDGNAAVARSRQAGGGQIH